MLEAVDAVLVAGDLYETSVPSAEAQRLVVHALIELRKGGTEVITMAGNHDHAGTFDAYRPLMAAAGIHLLGQARQATAGGVVSFHARSTGEPVNVAVLPFLTTRYAVRATELLTQTPAEHAGVYDQQVRELIDHLKTGFTPDAVNILMAHLTVTGGLLGGGERTNHFRLLRARNGVRFGPALCRAGTPTSPSVDARCLPGALQRITGRRRLRGGGERQCCSPRRGFTHQPGERGRLSDHRRSAATDGPGHCCRACHSCS